VDTLVARVLQLVVQAHATTPSSCAAKRSRARNSRLMMVPSRTRSARAASRYDSPTTSTATIA
jgi:hypothetical protein